MNYAKVSLIIILPCLAFANKPNLFLLKTYDKNLDVIDWVMSEKLDGIRGFWDGKELVSRGGHAFNPPKFWTDGFPNFEIDGELWTKRGDFERISSIVRQKTPDNRWEVVSFNIFEVPNQKGNLLERLDVLRAYLKQHPSKILKVIKQVPIKSKQQLNHFLEKVLDNKGEGVVVRHPKMPYQTGCLSNALKVKRYRDEECVVIEILSGKGKYKGKMGSVKCKTKKGFIIKIGSGFADVQRENPPIIGSEITFKYYGLTKNKKHKYPVFLKIKPKLTN